MHEALRLSAKHLPAIILLNLFTVAIGWMGHNLVLLPLSLNLTLGSFWLLALTYVAFFAYILLLISLTALHLFSLQAIAAEQLSFLDALRRAIHTFRKSAGTVIELGGVLLGMGLLVSILFLIFGVVIILPLVGLLGLFGLMSFWGLSSLFGLLAIILCAVLLLLCGAFLLTFQYGVWSQLFVRVEEGTASAKVVRIVKRLFKGRDYV
jgi:hypothetical protein